MRVSRASVAISLVAASAVCLVAAVAQSSGAPAPGRLTGVWRSHACSDCVRALGVTRTDAWIGTESGGVVRLDRASGAANRFTAADGLSGNHVHRLAVSPDGDIWVATRTTTSIAPPSGLSRWDGRHWTPHRDLDGMPAVYVVALAAGPGGTALAGFAGGALRFDGRAWHADSESDGVPGVPVTCVSVGADGGQWLGTARGVARFDGSRWIAVPSDELPTPSVVSMAAAADGTLWVLLATGDVAHLAADRWPGGRRWRVDRVERRGGQDLVLSAGGEVWIAGASAADFARFDGTRWNVVDVASETTIDYGTTVALSPEGEPWVGTLASGVGARQAGSWAWLRTDLGIPGSLGLSVAVDRAGRPWAGVAPALSPGRSVLAGRYDGERWTAYDATALGVSDAVLGVPTDGIDVDAAGAVWIVVDVGGVVRFDEGARTTWTVTDVIGVDTTLRQIEADDRGGAWVTSRRGAAHLGRGSWHRIGASDGLDDENVLSVAVDRRDDRETVWLGTGTGLAVWDGTRVRRVPEAGSAAVADVLVDRRGDALWLGRQYVRDALVLRYDGTFWTPFGPADGLGGEGVWAMTAAPDGAIWAAVFDDVAGQGGLYRFDGVRWLRHTAEDGLPDNVVFDVDVAPDGTVWAATVGGVGEFRPGIAPTPPVTPGTAVTPAPTATLPPDVTLVPPTPDPSIETPTPPETRSPAFIPIARTERR